eukprot:TRINITY_DN324_c0_g1_i12.p3 TRINITY_DN324_c0_g1~~TRINITY_DN324_c0_g1_i12.p3  ORF type:complete len:148 (-),score=24.09 TRINITY_DN324_c0_g1_i12:2716-3099(-)
MSPRPSASRAAEIEPPLRQSRLSPRAAVAPPQTHPIASHSQHQHHQQTPLRASDDVAHQPWTPPSNPRKPHSNVLHMQSQAKPSAFGNLVVTYDNTAAKRGMGRLPPRLARRASATTELEHDSLSGK